jgi:hypothetical protein
MIYSEHSKQVIASEREKKYIIVLFTDKTGLRGTAGIGKKSCILPRSPMKLIPTATDANIHFGFRRRPGTANTLSLLT